VAAAAPASKPTSSSKPTSIPTSRPVAKKLVVSEAARSAVKNAIVALNKEYEQSLRKPNTDTLRTSCNYFADHPSKDLTPEAIFPTLLTSGVGDIRATAYVRWQLLSGLPPKLDDDAAAKQLLAAYRASPGPTPRFGVSADDQQKLDRLVQSAKLADEPDVRAKVDEAVTASRRANGPVLAYREELYRRLPKTPETFAVALDDLSQRNAAVSDAKDLIKAFVADVRAWAASSDPAPSPQTLAALGKAVRRLADTKGPQYYDAPYWRESAHVFAWRKTRSGVDSGHALKDLAVLLEEQSRQPPIDLTIKTEPTKKSSTKP
jgi:hypothetical protein